LPVGLIGGELVADVLRAGADRGVERLVVGIADDAFALHVLVKARVGRLDTGAGIAERARSGRGGVDASHVLGVGNVELLHLRGQRPHDVLVHVGRHARRDGAGPDGLCGRSGILANHRVGARRGAVAHHGVRQTERLLLLVREVGNLRTLIGLKALVLQRLHKVEVAGRGRGRARVGSKRAGRPAGFLIAKAHIRPPALASCQIRRRKRAA
jgi:hypothetical protein